MENDHQRVFAFLLACFLLSCILAFVHRKLKNSITLLSSDINSQQNNRSRKHSKTISLCYGIFGDFSLKRLRNWKKTVYLCALTSLWYSISLSFTLFNKWFMQQYQQQFLSWCKLDFPDDKKFAGFNYPIIITAVHMVVKCLTTRLWRCTSPSVTIPVVPWSIYFTVVVPIGVLTAMDIVLSNQSILYLPLSLCTAVKASSLVFTFFFGLCPCLETHSFQLQTLLCVLAITAGLVLAIVYTPQPQPSHAHMNRYFWLGLLFATGSAAAGGLRWVLLQKLVERDSSFGKEDPASSGAMLTLYRFSPVSAAAILPFAVGLELPELLDQFLQQQRLLPQGPPRQDLQALYFSAAGLAAGGGALAVCLIVVEVKLLRATSSLTMSVIGQLKEVLMILIAMSLFSEQVTAASAGGIALSVLASYLYRRAGSPPSPPLQRSRDSDSDICCEAFEEEGCGEEAGGDVSGEEAVQQEGPAQGGEGLLEMLPLLPMQIDTRHLDHAV